MAIFATMFTKTKNIKPTTFEGPTNRVQIAARPIYTDTGSEKVEVMSVRHFLDFSNVSLEYYLNQFHNLLFSFFDIALCGIKISGLIN